MGRANVVMIDHLEVSKSDIEKVKRVFRIHDNAEAIRKALDVAIGKLELEGIFEKHKGAKLKKIYA
ncbi:MAG: hypothetical protein FIA94_03690 [Nitrospirae bacterium]|nr:hypothetical protein [Nitrospirota bacterium]